MIKIDVDTRKFEIPWEEKLLGVESDEKVKKLKFEVSKNEYFSGLNFTDSACYINYKNGNVIGQYGITDVIESDGKVTFTWEVSREATRYKGKTYAILCAKKVREDGTIIREWNSSMGQFNVYEGIEPTSYIIEEPEIDIISQLLAVAQQANANALTNITKSEELIASAQELLTQGNYYQGVIVGGESYSGIASNSGIKLHKVVGKTEQDGEPSPDNEVPIQNVNITKINAGTNQLFDASKLPTKSAGGLTVTNNNDGSLTLSGSGKLSSVFSHVYTFTYEETLKILKVGKLYLKGENEVYPKFDVGLIDKMGRFVSGKFISTNSKTVSFDISEDDLSPENGYRLHYQFYGDSNKDIISGTIKPMLYQDGDGTWEPFKHASVETSITLAEGDVFENGVVTRKRVKVEINENTIIVKNESSGATRFDCAFANNPNFLGGRTGSGVCNRLKPSITPISGNSQDEAISCYENGGVYFRLDRFSTVEELKEWLKTNPIIYEYDLVVQKTEALKVPTISSYYPNTNIWTDNTVSTDIQWKLLADSDKSLEVEAQEKRIQALEKQIIGG